MEPTVDLLIRSLPPKLKEEVSRDWVRGELLDLLLKYPGGVTDAIAQTHIFSKIQQNRQKTYCDRAGSQGSPASPGALDNCSLSSVAVHRGPRGGCAEVQVTGVRLHRVGVLSDLSNSDSVGSSTEGATLELLDGSWKGQCSMRLHQRFWHLLRGKRSHLSVGARIRLANLKPYRCSSANAPTTGPRLRLLPTEELIVVATEHQLHQHSEALCDIESLRHVECSAAGGRVVLRGRLLCRVKSIGAVSCGCRCALCDASKEGQHRVITLQQHKAGGSAPSSLPFVLYDKQVALGDLLREGEMLAMDAVTVHRLSPTATQCVAAADSQSQRCSPPQSSECAPLCLEIGTETIMWVAEKSAVSDHTVPMQGGAKKLKLDTGDAVGYCAGASRPARVLLGELLSIRYTKGLSATQAGSTQYGSTQMASTQALRENPPSLCLFLRTSWGKVEVDVGHKEGRRELLRLARNLQPGHVVLASGIEPTRMDGPSGQCRSYALELGGAGQLQSVSTLPGLLASPQLNREYICGLEEAIGFGERKKLGQVGEPLIKLAQVILGELQVRVRRVHQHCRRPLIGSSLLEGFFDDDDCEESGGIGSESTDMPMTPSRVGPDFRDGLWECRFCDRECGSSEVEAQPVGFFSARDATGRGAETWFAAEGAVLEALLGMPVTQYIGLSSEGRTALLKAMRGKQALLSLCPVVGPESSRLAFDGWTLCHGVETLSKSCKVPANCATVHIAAALLT